MVPRTSILPSSVYVVPEMLTRLDGCRRTSPIPPPFLKPLFKVVTMHMNNVSHARSTCSSADSSTRVIDVLFVQLSLVQKALSINVGMVEAKNKQNKIIHSIVFQMRNNDETTITTTNRHTRQCHCSSISMRRDFFHLYMCEKIITKKDKTQDGK